MKTFIPVLYLSQNKNPFRIFFLSIPAYFLDVQSENVSLLPENVSLLPDTFFPSNFDLSFLKAKF